ncbi:protein lifeguard 1 isoform X1 [Anthonomus grandis grandis]|uniref:protein lifeguard 1 isoform X1 n=1 Tax=Anthonomus grandis grandis TaxID=2921223 RepID=UPI0021658179|nr:protein lifeguard 1 isoform X1 [Anthonomus grandis grandis]XP_050300695.1 protein lifeguard 1 isoform X1 [Anthonomus grandis grandis]
MSYNYNQTPYPGQQQPGYNPGYPPPPQAGYPQGGYPQGGYPPGGYPQGGYAPPPQPGFQPPPYSDPYGGQQGEAHPFNSTTNAPGYGGYNPEDPEIKGFDFSDQSIRRGFIRKVYSILMVQLAITCAFIALFSFEPKTKHFVQTTPSLFFVALALMIVAIITLACCGEVRRKAPMNYIVLFIFTIAEGFLLGVSASTYDQDAVIMAAGITTVVCLALTLFAFQTKYDFTMMGGILLVAVVVLFMFGILAIFIHNKIFQLVYASLGALIFSFYLIYDTQMMLGGKHKYSISPEEYVFAALNLYLDIINIFMYILAIIGNSRD